MWLLPFSLSSKISNVDGVNSAIADQTAEGGLRNI